MKNAFSSLLITLTFCACSSPVVEGDCSQQSCRFGERCVDGACVPERCAGPSDCISPLVCVGGLCMNSSEPPAGCQGDGDCPAGLRCERDGQCVGAGCMEGDVRNCEGPCGVGVQSCVSGSWRACNSPLPSIEACGGGDEDCDGTVDEGCDPCGEGERRACQSPCGVGEEVCSGGRWGACDAPTPDPTTGACRSAECIEGEQQGCASACGPGTRRCVGERWGECAPNDPMSCGCVEGAREPCESPCGPGERLCSDGLWGGCSPLDPSACGCADGATQGCASQIEGCQLISRCIGGSWGDCLPASDERCGDMLDNDCDTVVDEGCAANCDPPLLILSELSDVRAAPFLTIGGVRWGHDAFAVVWTESAASSISYFGRWNAEGQSLGGFWTDEGTAHDLISTGTGFMLLRSTFEGLYLDRFNRDGLHQERVGPFGEGSPYSATLALSGAERVIVAASYDGYINLSARFLNGQEAEAVQQLMTQDIGNNLDAVSVPGGALITFSEIQSFDPYRSDLFSVSIDGRGVGGPPQRLGEGQDGALAPRDGGVGLAFTRVELPRAARSMFLSLNVAGQGEGAARELYESPLGPVHGPALIATRSGFLWGAHRAAPPGLAPGQGELLVTSLNAAGQRPGEIQRLRNIWEERQLQFAWNGERVGLAATYEAEELIQLTFGIYQPRCP